MTSDAFINALRCFIALRGKVQQIRSDQGTNFVGARNEFLNLQEKEVEKIQVFLSEQQCEFVMNTLSSSFLNFHISSCSSAEDTLIYV